MKAKAKPHRVFQGIYIPSELDGQLREIAASERRSVTQAAVILLENALKRQNSAKKAGETA
jgi:hypothetical protein